jgi:superkiller protein 3
LFPPKHHARAIPIIDEILAEDPDNVSCLMGRAYIFQHAHKWADAGRLFSNVTQLLPNDLFEGLRAKEEYAWCQGQTNQLQPGISGLKVVLEALEKLEDRDVDKARCLWRLGKCYWDLGCNASLILKAVHD